jgi:cytochrome c oxidase subunit 4
MAHAEGQQHPIAIYLLIWGLLFVLSFFSYMVDYLHLEGLLRWSLIILFMMLKAGFIVAIFMHMAWERLALVYAILVPPVLLLVFALSLRPGYGAPAGAPYFFPAKVIHRTAETWISGIREPSPYACAFAPGESY